MFATVAALLLVAVACAEEDAPAEDIEAEDIEADDAAPEEDVDAEDVEASDDPYEVATDLGTVVGTESDVAGVRAFLTIPFAAPPTGENRFRAPQPHPGWDEPLLATEAGFGCPQDEDSLLAAILVSPETDEDCLTLNVWAPDDAEDLPVMVWIHGGGLTTGSAHQPYYIGDNLAARGVVLVSMNYRLGPFGFLAHDELAAERDDGAVGNYGLRDQIAALEWVQRNAAAFGGDPDDVTVFGESAGGFSVCALLALDDADALFRQASILSGGGCDRFVETEEAADAATAFLEEIGCDDIECARELPAEDLVDVPFRTSFVLDGALLTRSARDLAAAGEIDLPVLVGANADEATLFTIGMEEPSDEELVDLAGGFGGDPEAILELYPPERFDSNLERYQALSSDARFICPAEEFAGLLPRAYHYHYTFVSPDDPFGLGATHGAELALLFGHPEGIIGLDVDPGEETRRVAEDIQAAWVGFARTGEPSSDWPPYTDSGEIMLLDDPFELVEEIRDGRCPALLELMDRG